MYAPPTHRPLSFLSLFPFSPNPAPSSTVSLSIPNSFHSVIPLRSSFVRSFPTPLPLASFPFFFPRRSPRPPDARCCRYPEVFLPPGDVVSYEPATFEPGLWGPGSAGGDVMSG
eukprot:1910801-Rhodomonas_salina.4